ncbi:BnaC03g57260D [Brassica napus]|uniref:RING-type E3 ubiquitin transferase n=1 Tax=Brassica napus TaxID=3708 RepID=A0A078GFK5_BRANA|nr:BnaC03g57260D [Brassica napus]
MGENGRHRWFSFNHHRSASATSMPQNNPGETPAEFLCPITGFLMSDPVVVASGQTFERISVQVCRNLGFAPKLHDGSQPDLSTVIPNLAMKSTILSWCNRKKVEHPRPPDYAYVEGVVRARMDKEPVTYSSSSESSFSTSDYSSFPPMSEEEEEIYNKLRSANTVDHEQGLILLRKTTRSSESSRISLCTERLLSLLRSLIVSRYNIVQTNAAASLVNLSLEKPNKLKIVRSGFVPLLIDVLKSGSTEAQEHVIGALFSLAVEEENKMVIGVLGAVEPLLHALRSSESERARQDAALALYHLSLIPNNRTRLVRAGAVPMMLSMVRSGESASRILLLLCNLAACSEGKGAMLDGNGVAILVGKLREGGADSEAARENCVGALLTLSVGNMRFRGLASEAGAVEILTEIVESEGGSERLKEKAGKILQAMRGGEREFGEGAEAREWNRMLEASGLSRSQLQGGQKEGFAYSSQF